MQLAWNKLNTIMPDMQLHFDDPVAVDMVKKFNTPVLFASDINESDVYITAGRVLADQVNQEVKEKFPNKSIDDVKYELVDPCDFIVYVYLFKEMQFPTPFTEWSIRFDGGSSRYKWFRASDADQRNNIRIHNYVSDDQFLISLTTKQNDRIYLAKGYNMQDPTSVIEDIRTNTYTETMKPKDLFSMPKISLQAQRKYSDLIGKNISSAWYCGGAGWTITEMIENIRFNIDHIWAKVENDALIVVNFQSEEIDTWPKPRNFTLDQPFWIVMQQDNAKNPYLILGIRNAALMEKE